MELPKDWYDLLRDSRKKPEPFKVVPVRGEKIKKWTMFFEQKFASKCPFPIQKVRELRLTQDRPGLVYHRSTYNGVWESHSVNVRRKKNIFKKLSGHKKHLH